ncbi:hypothetical protein [uncultured Methanospirillum sp.]|uniref:hypothetical protein n=1 Tax=uncultured Methanospirillum sp. TaxID=262503 RepID=UPI0029C66071|nr:hypothetical protein [uncultured Methanospirillum sp.]
MLTHDQQEAVSTLISSISTEFSSTPSYPADKSLWENPADIIPAIRHVARHIEQEWALHQFSAGTLRDGIAACFGYRESGLKNLDFSV